MRIIAICLFCFVAAFCLGRWTPHYDLALAQLKIKELEAKIEQEKTGSSSQVTSMLGIRPANKQERKNNVKTLPDPANTNTPPAITTATTSNQVIIAKSPQKHEGRSRRRRDRPAEERLDEAIELWELRTELAKTTFMDQLGGNKEDVINFNVLMESLNLRTQATISNWVERVEHQETISTEDGIRLFNDILDSVVLTYDEMDRKLPENWREGVDDDFQLMEMIDPRVAKPLIKLEDKMGEVRFF